MNKKHIILYNIIIIFLFFIIFLNGSYAGRSAGQINEPKSKKYDSFQINKTSKNLNIGILFPFYKDDEIKNTEYVKIIEQSENICKELLYKKGILIIYLEYPKIVKELYSNERLDTPSPDIKYLLETDPNLILTKLKKNNPKIKGILVGNVEKDFENKILFCLRLFINNLDDAIVIKKRILIKAVSLDNYEIENEVKDLLKKMIYIIIDELTTKIH